LSDDQEDPKPQENVPETFAELPMSREVPEPHVSVSKVNPVIVTEGVDAVAVVF